ncbi:hypothetical protein EYF80_003126 [Liparis tanakae]|uniref:Uncharacterized protein n=1 Tax=Liparis tanakae TaxID=230148 RepID=A0A4Z2JAF7_9TELE|nr:hypothetical protein EYF80_003126 [Liparis tanakae]
MAALCSLAFMRKAAILEDLRSGSMFRSYVLMPVDMPGGPPNRLPILHETLISSVLHYLHAGFSQVRPQRQLLPGVNVRIVRLLEDLLQLFQLIAEDLTGLCLVACQRPPSRTDPSQPGNWCPFQTGRSPAPSQSRADLNCLYLQKQEGEEEGCVRDGLDHWITGSLDHWTTGSLDHWITGSLDHWITGPLDHWTTGSLDHWTTGCFGDSVDHSMRCWRTEAMAH